MLVLTGFTWISTLFFTSAAKDTQHFVLGLFSSPKDGPGGLLKSSQGIGLACDRDVQSYNIWISNTKFQISPSGVKL